jgi:hypothetical protein
MPLDFPTSPTNGQAYQGYVYSTDVGAWQAKPSAQSPFYTGDTPPGNPVVGDSWFNTNDGTMYVYFNDGNTSQWVEHRSEIARSQVGLVPVRPTSVTMGSGTSTIDINGLVTFTTAGSYVMLNGVFTSSFRNYRIHLSTSTSIAAAIDFRYSVGGTASSAGYTQGNGRFAGNVFDNYSMGFNGPRHYLGIQGGSQANSFAAAIDVFTPNLATYTNHIFTGTGYDASYPITLSGGGSHQVATAYDGIYFMPASGTITGTVKVYGYN